MTGQPVAGRVDSGDGEGDLHITGQATHRLAAVPTTNAARAPVLYDPDRQQSVDSVGKMLIAQHGRRHLALNFSARTPLGKHKLLVAAGALTKKEFFQHQGVMAPRKTRAMPVTAARSAKRSSGQHPEAARQTRNTPAAASVPVE